jgi:hypothetical protein
MKVWRAIGILLIGLLVSAVAQAGTWRCDRVANGESVLIFEGGVGPGEYQRFRAEFNSCFPRGYLGQRVVNLYSGGGLVGEALAIARDIVSEGRGPRPIATRIRRGSHCISACTFLFVAGRLRDVETGGSFEPHGFSIYLGPRIDIALEKARAAQLSVAELQISRLMLLADWLPKLAEDDPRFKWAASWVGKYLPEVLRTGSAMGTALPGFALLSRAQREFIQQLDSVISVVMPEVERVSALKEFEQLLADSGNPLVREAPTFDAQIYKGWITKVTKSAANEYLQSLREIRLFELGDAFSDQVLASLRENNNSTRKNLSNPNGLGPYLVSRGDEIDVAGLVTLMFSTSILYVRPVSREEMCDLNIVNRDCAN